MSCLLHYFTHFQRVNLFFYNPDFLAAYFVFSLPLSLALLHQRYRNYLLKNSLTKIDFFIYLLTLIQIGGFITTFSRAGSLGFGASTLFLIALAASKKQYKITAASGLIIIIFCMIIIMSLPDVFSGLLDVRSPIWHGTYEMIRKNILTGSGIGSFSKLYPAFRPPHYFLLRHAAPSTVHSHNEFLEIWAELGAIGLLLYLCLLGSIFVYAIKKIEPAHFENTSEQILIKGMLSGVLGLLIHNTFSMSLRIPFITFYLWLGLGLSTGISMPQNISVFKIDLENILKRTIFIIVFLFIILSAFVKFVLFPFIGDFYFERGYIERTKSNLTGALDYYSKAIRFSADRPDIYYSRAFILNNMGKEKEALEDYLKIEKISPGYGKIYLNLGITYLSMGEVALAVEKLKMAITANPYDSQAHNSLGVAYAKSNSPAKARKEFEQALCLNPELKEAKINLIKLGNNYIP